MALDVIGETVAKMTVESFIAGYEEVRASAKTAKTAKTAKKKTAKKKVAKKTTKRR